MLRAHRLAVGFYNEDPETGKIVRTDRFELDVDELTVVDAAAGKARPSLILVNDDDLTYTKLRFDDKSPHSRQATCTASTTRSPVP